MNSKVKSMIASRRFWVAAAGLAAVVGQDILGVELDTDQVVAVASIVVAWVIGDTVRETK
jgi:uncharacterized membrane protein